MNLWLCPTHCPHNTEKSIGLTNNGTITISYLDSDNVSIKFSSADGSSSYTVSIADDQTDATDIDFKDAAKQKFYFVVANEGAVVYKTNSIKVQFDKDLTISGSSITDNAANEFEHFSAYIAADGAVKVQGTAFSMNDGVWPAGKQLKKVEFDLSVGMSGAADKHIMLGYYFTDANNYKALEIRETSSPGCNLYMAFVDVVKEVITMKKEYLLPIIKVKFETDEKICADNWNILSGKLEGEADQDEF